MFDNVLLISVVVVILAAFIGAFIRGRRKDTCLKSFRGYTVTVLQKSGKRIWGRLQVESTGLELKYRADYTDIDHIESSFIMYKSEYPSIDLVIRYLDELTPSNLERRKKMLRHSYRPGFVRRMRRRIRNVLNTVRDGVNDAMNMLLSQVKVPGASAQAQSRVSKTGLEAVESAGNAYDPILEKHIGKKVVLEVSVPNAGVIEHVGVFREYSPDFLEVMNIQFPEGGMAHA